MRYRAGAEGSWHLGMLTDRRRYVGLEQSAGPVSSMVERFVDPEATQTGEVTVAGERWQTWSDSGEDHALVRRVEGTTTLVVGDRAAGRARRLRRHPALRSLPVSPRRAPR